MFVLQVKKFISNLAASIVLNISKNKMLRLNFAHFGFIGKNPKKRINLIAMQKHRSSLKKLLDEFA